MQFAGTVGRYIAPFIANEFKSHLVRTAQQEASKAIYDYVMPRMPRRPRSRKRKATAYALTTRRAKQLRLAAPPMRRSNDFIRGRNMKRRRTRRPSRKGPKLTKKVNKLVRFMNQQTAEHIRRVRNTGRIFSNYGQVLNANIASGSTFILIQAAMANLRYYDPGTNALVTADAATGTYSRDIMVSIYRRLTFHNTRVFPVHIQVFSCFPKDATDQSPNQAYLSGLADQGASAAASPLTYVSDSKDLSNIWDIRKVCDKTLQAGQSMVCKAVTSTFPFTIATNDVQTLPWQRKQGGHSWFVRINGPFSHESGTSAIGMMDSAADYISDVVYKFTYDAGKDLHDISVEDNSPTFLAGGVISQKPTAANYTATAP